MDGGRRNRSDSQSPPPSPNVPDSQWSKVDHTEGTSHQPRKGFVGMEKLRLHECSAMTGPSSLSKLTFSEKRTKVGSVSSLAQPDELAPLQPQWRQCLVQSLSAVSHYLSNWRSYFYGCSRTMRIVSELQPSKYCPYLCIHSMREYGDPSRELTLADETDTWKRSMAIATTKERK